MGAAAIEQPAQRRAGLGLRRRSDEHLAALVARGNAPAFELLFERHHTALLSFCRHMLGRAHDAEDAVQHTFAAAHRSFSGGKTPDNVRGWLFVVARNRCLSLLRARREQPGYAELDLPSTENLVADVEHRADLRELLGDLQRLPDDQRAALVLSELGDLSHDEVAAVIEVPTKKVKALVFQARETLLSTADARARPCAEVREEIAVATGAELRRRHLRLHLETCEGCREFRSRVKGQKAALAAILPVVPTLALREGVIGGLAAGGGGGGGLLAALFGAPAASKVAAGVVVAGVAAGGGTAVVKSTDDPPQRRAPVVRQAAPVPAGAPTLVPAAGQRSAVVPMPAPAAKSQATKKAKKPKRAKKPKQRGAATLPAGAAAPAHANARAREQRKQTKVAVKAQRTAVKAIRKAAKKQAAALKHNAKQQAPRGKSGTAKAPKDKRSEQAEPGSKSRSGD